jgi:hypothetical protein
MANDVSKPKLVRRTPCIMDVTPRSMLLNVPGRPLIQPSGMTLTY